MGSVKVISSMTPEDGKSLLLQLPEHLLNSLKISIDGLVDVHQLISLLIIMEQEATLQTEELNMTDHIALMVNIFDESRAVDFNHRAVRS